MAGTRKLEVEFLGNTKDLEKAFKRVDNSADKSKGKMAAFGGGAAKAAKGAGVGMAAGVGIGVVAIKGFVGAAKDSEVSQAAMRAQLKASGIKYKKHADEIDRVIKKHSDLSGLDDEDLQDSFTNIVRVTGDVDKALKLNGLAADFARAKHIDVAKAGEIVGKVAGGNTGILSRYGIKIKDGATSTEALGVMQKKFAGQAEAYGKTAAGAQDRFSVATENVKEMLGAKFLPVITSVTGKLATFVQGLSDGKGIGGKFATALSDAWGTAKTGIEAAIGFIGGLFDKHKGDLSNVGDAVKNLGTAVVFMWDNVALPVIKRVLPAIEGIVKGTFDVIGGVIKVISSVLTGDFGGAWEGVKKIFSGAIQIVLGMLRGMTAPVREAFSKIASAINWALDAGWELVKGAVRAVAGWLGDRWGNIKDAASGAWNGIKDTITGAIRGAIDWVKEKLGGEGLGGWLRDKWSDIAGGVTAFATNVKDGVIKAFQGAVNLVIDFVNSIIKAINLIPGVPDIKLIGHVGGGSNGGEGGNPNSRQGFAKGGAFGRTGGLVDRPITLMGEEAPRHPEFVIPTNPAYRGRAQKLLSQASQAVGVNGLARGGIFGGGGVSGLWDVIGKGPGAFINALPGAGGLPEWLQGTGKYVLGKVTAWIKDQIGGLFGGSANGNAGPGAGLSPTQRIARMMKAAIDIDSKGFPYVYGGGHSAGTFDGPYDCSGLVSAILRAGGLMSGSMTTDGLKTYGASGDGENVTIGVRGSTGRSAHTMMELAGRFIESGSGHGAAFTPGWSGGFPIKRHPNGLAMGGQFGGLPYVGRFHDGGVSASEGMAHVTRGEVMFSPSNPPEFHIYIGDREITDMIRVEIREDGRRLAGSYRAGAA